jgi:hypothetical protein
MSDRVADLDCPCLTDLSRAGIVCKDCAEKAHGKPVRIRHRHNYYTVCVRCGKLRGPYHCFGTAAGSVGHCWGCLTVLELAAKERRHQNADPEPG